MADNNRGRDIGKLRRMAPQEKKPLTLGEQEDIKEQKRRRKGRNVMKQLEPRIRELNGSLMGTPVKLPSKMYERQRKLVTEALSLGLDDKLPEALLKEVGLASEPNPKVPDEDDDGSAPF